MTDSSIRPGAAAHVPDNQSLGRQDDGSQEMHRIGRTRFYANGHTIIAEGNESTIVGRMTSGIMRITQTLDDGRQQVVGLVLPGDYFGHFFRSNGAFAYEAATDVVAYVVPQKVFEALLATDHDLKHRIMMNILRDLELSREWMMVLGCQNTFERVVSFMLHIHKRMCVAGITTHSDIIEFPISRRDIAGYLGTSMETISRHIQTLARQKNIRIMDSSHFQISNLRRLQSVSKQHWDGRMKCGPGGEAEPYPPLGSWMTNQSQARLA